MFVDRKYRLLSLSQSPTEIRSLVLPLFRRDSSNSGREYLMSRCVNWSVFDRRARGVLAKKVIPLPIP